MRETSQKQTSSPNNSINYLHRVFKRKYGITPIQYRERHHTHPQVDIG
ncbi:AraC family transcriptional regulator [Paenibacillus luteus]